MDHSRAARGERLCKPGLPVPLRFGLDGPIKYGLTYGGSPKSANARRPEMKIPALDFAKGGYGLMWRDPKPE